MSLTLKFYRMERICIIFFRFFMNFISSCAQYIHDKPMYIVYVPWKINPV
jgi:hypothetical protein